jgi:hypothetical protein
MFISQTASVLWFKYLHLGEGFFQKMLVDRPEAANKF